MSSVCQAKGKARGRLYLLLHPITRGTYHPGGGDHAHPASSQACHRPISQCPRPLAPRNVWLGRL